MKKPILVGIFISMLLGGAFVGFLFQWINRDNFEFQDLTHGYLNALKVNKRTGEAWGLTSLGTWVQITNENWTQAVKERPK